MNPEIDPVHRALIEKIYGLSKDLYNRPTKPLTSEYKALHQLTSALMELHK